MKLKLKPKLKVPPHFSEPETEYPSPSSESELKAFVFSINNLKKLIIFFRNP
jgi:hypothetical protein